MQTFLQCFNSSIFKTCLYLAGTLNSTTSSMLRGTTAGSASNSSRLHSGGTTKGANDNRRDSVKVGVSYNIILSSQESPGCSAYRADRPAIRQAKASVFPSFFSQLKSRLFFGLNFPSLGLKIIKIAANQSEYFGKIVFFIKKCFS